MRAIGLELMHREKLLIYVLLGDKKSLTEANTAQLIFFSYGKFYPARAQDVKMRLFMQVLLSEKSFCSRL